MMETRLKGTPGASGDVAIAGHPLSYFLAGSSDQTDVAAHRLSAHIGSIKALLQRLEDLVVPERLSVAARLSKDVTNYRTQVSLIGQVKAGKTKLTNALTGMPEMLPSDVNPWTSVVTSIHVNTPKPRGSDAVFTFYTEEDWSGLTEDGGHLGKLAQRANFEAELDEMRAQVSAMRAKTEARLGSNFGFLLGSQHQFRGFSPGLLEKYVCLGEDGDVTVASGRYADVTKAADLYIDSTDFVLPTTISDTPGVNDPFLARERATLATLGKTDICVIVLSANQAFSTVDLALMRVLMAMKAEQIILFVNRVDELENPDAQIPEIDDFIRGILQSKGIKTRVPDRLWQRGLGRTCDAGRTVHHHADGPAASDASGRRAGGPGSEGCGRREIPPGSAAVQHRQGPRPVRPQRVEEPCDPQGGDERRRSVRGRSAGARHRRGLAIHHAFVEHPRRRPAGPAEPRHGRNDRADAAAVAGAGG